jgi:hypothetical protein
MDDETIEEANWESSNDYRKPRIPPCTKERPHSLQRIVGRSPTANLQDNDNPQVHMMHNTQYEE